MSAALASARPLLLHRPVTATAGAPRRTAAACVSIRRAEAADVHAVGHLIADHADEGRLLPRSDAEIAAQIDRFLVAVSDDRVVGCAALEPLSTTTAEVRSLVVSAGTRGSGIGGRLLEELVGRATQAGFTRLTAFTHAPRFFVRTGFALVPHAWVPEKIARDCRGCDQFRQCSQFAVSLTLDRATLRSSVHA